MTPPRISRGLEIVIAAAIVMGLSSVLLAASVGLAEPPIAYVGPGAGLGAIGALLAVLAAIVIGVIGLVLYPLHMLRSWLRGAPEPAGETPSDAGHTA